MNDEDLYEYLIQMGAMRPEQESLSRKQAYVDALRGQSMQPLQGQMAGRVYVGPSFTQGLAQLGQAYGARKAQQGVDERLQELNSKQKSALDRIAEMRRFRKQAGNVDTSKFYKPDEEDLFAGFTPQMF